MTQDIPLPSSTPTDSAQKSAALTERSGFQATKAQADTPEAPSNVSQAQAQCLPWWRRYSGIFSASILTITVSSLLKESAPGDIVNTSLMIGTGWLFFTRFRRFGFRTWLPVVAAFLGFNMYSFLMSGVLHWGEAAYHLMMFFGSVTALLFFMVITLVLPAPKVAEAKEPILPTRTELAIELAKEELARLLTQDKTDDPEFLAWQSVLERYDQVNALEKEAGEGV